jgi:hypothetical protein
MKQKTKRKVKYKATLTFPLDDSFDTNKFKRALTADGAYISLYDINELIIKHINNMGLDEKTVNIFIEFSKEFDNILDENKVDLDILE